MLMLRKKQGRKKKILFIRGNKYSLEEVLEFSEQYPNEICTFRNADYEVRFLKDFQTGKQKILFKKMVYISDVGLFKILPCRQRDILNKQDFIMK